MPLYQIFNQALHSFSQRFEQLPDKPEETAENSIRALWFAAADQARAIEKINSRELPDLTENQIERFKALVQERISGVPLAHLTGKQSFMGIELLVSRQALIPRKETALLGDAALRCIRETIARKGASTVIDVCTGCGNLPLVYAFYELRCKIFASDLSAEAIALAKANANNLKLKRRIIFKVGNLFDPFKKLSLTKSVDVISCNPPYISTGKLARLPKEIIAHEPELAFDGGPFGLKIINGVVCQAQEYLTDSGWLCIEVGERQGPGIIRLMKRRDFYRYIEPVYDYNNNIRCIMARV